MTPLESDQGLLSWNVGVLNIGAVHLEYIPHAVGTTTRTQAGPTLNDLLMRFRPQG